MANKNTRAWLLLVSAFALHVADEAVSGFPAFYNPLVTQLRENLGFFPLPTFSFSTWIALLAVAVTVGYAMTIAVHRGSPVARVLAVVVGIIMILNSLGHLIASAFLQRFLPGFWSSPFLLVTAVYVVFRGLSGRWAPTLRRK